MTTCPKCGIPEFFCDCPQWHPANPYPSPAGRLDDKPGYPWNTLPKWQGSVLAPPASDARIVEDAQRTQTNPVADTTGARRSSLVPYRMRYRRKAGRALV